MQHESVTVVGHLCAYPARCWPRNKKKTPKKTRSSSEYLLGSMYSNKCSEFEGVILFWIILRSTSRPGRYCVAGHCGSNSTTLPST